MDGLQESEDGSDKLTFSTRGDFTFENGSYYITYEESETTGFTGNTTTLLVEDENRVVLNRVGPHASQLIIEKGKKHLCHFMTDFGDLMIGVRADRITNRLNADGGQLNFKYALDLNASELATNELNITVRKLQ